MTDLDLERLGDVWRQRPDPKELEELRRAANRVQRRARWLQAVDIVSAIVVSGVVLFLVGSNPRVDTMLVGGGAILVLLVSQVRSRQFRQKELRSLTGSTEEMLDQSIERVQATLHRARSGLVLLPIAVLLGLGVASLAVPIPEREVAEWVTRLGGARVLPAAAILAIAVGLVHLVRTMRRNREELEKLVSLRDAYRGEQESANSEPDR